MQPRSHPEGTVFRDRSTSTLLARRAPREQGYILLAVLFMAFLLALSLAIAAPKMAASIEQDRERELIQRGLQYQRAVQLYYRKFGAFPPTVDALVKTNTIRFLRKRYKDPITGKDDWVPIHYGEAKTPILGFFGQPLAGAAPGGAAMGGVGPSGGNANIGTPAAGAGNSSSGFSLGSSSFGSGMGGATAGSTAGSSTSPTGSSSFGSNTPSDFGGSSQTFGGAGIIGFKIPSNKQALLEYKKQKHFNEWEFYYDPSEEQFLSGNAALGQPIPVSGSSDATTFGGSTFGSSPGANGSSGFGSSSGSFGSSSPSGFGSSSSSGSSSPTSAQPQ